jgi:hypothetical protein
MKNIILATTLLVAFSSAAFATEKNVDAKLYRDLAATFKNSTQVCWIDKPQFTQAMFKFNDQLACAYYSPNSNELIGFGILYDKTNLPGVVSDGIKTKYGDWDVIDAMMFVDTNGYLNYFVQVKKNDKGLALKITPGGNVSVYTKIHS